MKFRGFGFLCFFLFFFNFLLNSQNLDDVQEFTLENSLKTFILEDFSTPLVRVEFRVKAGFSDQIPKTTGFFELFANIISASFEENFFSEWDCTSDSTYFVIIGTEDEVLQKTKRFSDLIFEAKFSDEIISSELLKMKKKVSQNMNDVSYFINSAIDSRVFANSPWKHESGIYPSIFRRQSLENTRNILTYIAKRYFIPENSVFFVSGNVNSNEFLEKIKEISGIYYGNVSKPFNFEKTTEIQQRKFVLHHKEISDDFTQIVIQYFFEKSEDSAFSAFVHNLESSPLKTMLLQEENLNIFGSEYINAASASKKQNHRLIIQSLMQNSAEKNSNPLEQAQKFSEICDYAVQNTNEILNQEIFEKLKEVFSEQIIQKNISSFELMRSLAEFWAIEDFEKNENSQNSEKEFDSITAQNFYSTKEKILQKNDFPVPDSQPFVFVLISENSYKKYKNEFLKAGFEEISTKNASWYTQKIFENEAKDAQNSIKKLEFEKKIKASEQNESDIFYENGISSINTTILSNGIPVAIQKNDSNSKIAVVVKISGGELKTFENHGFEEVMTNLLLQNFQNEIDLRFKKNLIKKIPEITGETLINESKIKIELENSDFEQTMDSFVHAIIYGNLIPSSADRAVSSRQYKKRLYNGSTQNQLYAEGIKAIYGENEIYKIVEADEEILGGTQYSKIQESYPDFVNASRFSVAIFGNVLEETNSVLEKTFGILPKSDFILKEEFLMKKFSSKPVYKKVRHTFLTDIPAEEAGPMPEVLIPTTKFLDPVVWFFESPEIHDENYAYYKAFINYLAKKIQSEAQKNFDMNESQVFVKFGNEIIKTSAIILTNVTKTETAEKILNDSLKKIREDLGNSNNSKESCKKIFEFYVNENFGKNESNFIQIADFLSEGIKNGNPGEYLQNYLKIKKSSAKNYLEIQEKYFSSPLLRVYAQN